MGRASGGASRALGGAGDGVAATAAMSGIMYAAHRAGRLGRPPPATITDRALHLLGRDDASDEKKTALTWVAHLTFGASAGALYAAPGRAPRSWGRAAVEGAAFGAAVWLVSYAGWVPALSILPPPHRDRRGRPTSMLVSHLVFGAVLGLLGERRRRAP